MQNMNNNMQNPNGNMPQNPNGPQPKQFSTDMLTAGDTFVVRGKTSYAKLTRVIDGDELREEIQRATQQGRVPIQIPHSYTTLVDAYVEFADPSRPTTAELYAQERIFKNKDGRMCFTATRKGSTLAEYGVVDQTDPTKIHQIYLDPERHLENDLDVKCYFRIFDTKAGMHKGVSLDTVVFMEPVRYYSFSNSGSQLAQRGMTWVPTDAPAPAQPQSNDQSNFGQMNQPTDNAGYGQPNAGAGYGQPTQNPNTGYGAPQRNTGAAYGQPTQNPNAGYGPNAGTGYGQPVQNPNAGYGGQPNGGAGYGQSNQNAGAGYGGQSQTIGNASDSAFGAPYDY